MCVSSYLDIKWYLIMTQKTRKKKVFKLPKHATSPSALMLAQIRGISTQEQTV